MNASDAITAINQRLGTSYKIVGRYGQGESGAVSQIADAVSKVTDQAAHECPLRSDIVLFDFHTNNVLMENERISAVIDWEGCRSGDCAFDLATMLFYTWPFEEFRDRLWRALLERTSQGAVATYLAHMIVRQLDWSMRFHDAATVAHYMNCARQILGKISSP